MRSLLRYHLCADGRRPRARRPRRITLYTYALAFRLLQIGKASALGVLTLLFVAALVALMIRLVYRRERGAF